MKFKKTKLRDTFNSKLKSMLQGTLKGFTVIELIVGMAIGSIVVMAVFSFVGSSVNILGNQLSSFTARSQIYNLTRYLVDDVTSAQEVIISGEGKKMEVIAPGDEPDSPKVVYEYIDGYLYIKQRQAPQPMRTVKAERVEFSIDNGLVKLTALPGGASGFRIEISAYMRMSL